MPDLWTPSDDLLRADAIAEQKIVQPFEPPDLEAHGIVLPDIEDDEANVAAAAVAVASISEDENSEESGEVDDDNDLDEPDDEGDIDA